MDQQPPFTSRIGLFLILLGIALLIVFFGSGTSQADHYRYLLGGLVVLFIGFWLRSHAKKHGEPSRFRAVRGIYAKSKARSEKKKEKQKKQQQKSDDSYPIRTDFH